MRVSPARRGGVAFHPWGFVPDFRADLLPTPSTDSSHRGLLLNPLRNITARKDSRIATAPRCLGNQRASLYLQRHPGRQISKPNSRTLSISGVAEAFEFCRQANCTHPKAKPLDYPDGVTRKNTVRAARPGRECAFLAQWDWESGHSVSEGPPALCNLGERCRGLGRQGVRRR